MGGGVGRWPTEGGQGGNLTTGLIWLVMGRWRAGKGGTREQSNKNALVPLFGLPQKPNNWSDLAGDEGGGMGGRRGGWPMEGGGGHQRQKVHWFPLLGSLKHLTTGEAWGGGPWRAGKGGRGGGHQRAWEQHW